MKKYSYVKHKEFKKSSTQDVPGYTLYDSVISANDSVAISVNTSVSFPSRLDNTAVIRVAEFKVADPAATNNIITIGETTTRPTYGCISAMTGDFSAVSAGANFMALFGYTDDFTYATYKFLTVDLSKKHSLELSASGVSIDGIVYAWEGQPVPEFKAASENIDLMGAAHTAGFTGTFGSVTVIQNSKTMNIVPAANDASGVIGYYNKLDSLFTPATMSTPGSLAPDGEDKIGPAAFKNASNKIIQCLAQKNV